MSAVSDDVFPVCSPKFLATQTQPLSFEKLPEYRLLHHSSSPPNWLDWESWFERMGVDADVRRTGETYDSYPLTMQAAVEGHGLALGWKRASERLLGSGELVRPFNQHVSVPDSFGVYKPRNWKSKPHTSKVLDWIRSELK